VCVVGIWRIEARLRRLHLGEELCTERGRFFAYFDKTCLGSKVYIVSRS